MNGFLPDYSMQSSQHAKRDESLKRQKLSQQAAADPRLNPELQKLAGLTAQGLSGQDVNPLDSMLAGKAQGQAFQTQQAQFQGELKQAASGQGGQPQEQMPQGQAPGAAGWQKYVKGNVKYLNQFLPQY